MNENEKNEEEIMAEERRVSRELYLRKKVSEIISEIREILANQNLSTVDKIWTMKMIRDILKTDISEEKKKGGKRGRKWN